MIHCGQGINYYKILTDANYTSSDLEIINDNDLQPGEVEDKGVGIKPTRIVSIFIY